MSANLFSTDLRLKSLYYIKRAIMQECYKKIRENYGELRGIEDYSAAVGTVIAGFALLMKKRTAAGSIWGLTNRGFFSALFVY